jgi:hypothetical protein
MASPDDYRHSVVDNQDHHPDRQRGCLFGDYQFKGLGIPLLGRLLVGSMSGHSFRDYASSQIFHFVVEIERFLGSQTA